MAIAMILRPLRHLLCLITLLPLVLAAQSLAPAGPSFPALPESPSRQARPSVASDKLGNLVVVWVDTLRGGIVGRRFAADGSPLDAGFRISEPTARDRDSAPDVAMSQDGRFVVTWRRQTHPSGGSDFRAVPGRVQVRYYFGDGNARSPVIALAEEDPAADHGNPAVAILDDGRNVVTWDRRGAAPGLLIPGPVYGVIQLRLQPSQVVMQRLLHGGEIEGPRQWVADRRDLLADLTPIANFTAIAGLYARHDLAADVDIAHDASGNYAIVWRSLSLIEGGAALVALPVGGFASFSQSVIESRIFGTTGRFVTALPVRIDTAPYRFHLRPRVSFDSKARYVVAWTDVRNTLLAPTEVRHRLRVCVGSGARPCEPSRDLPLGDAAHIDTVNVLPTDTVLLTSSSDRQGDTSGITGQTFALDGQALAAPFRIDDDAYPPFDPRQDTAVDRYGNAVVVWQRYIDDGDSVGVRRLVAVP